MRCEKRVLEASSEERASGRWAGLGEIACSPLHLAVYLVLYVTNALISLHVFAIHHCLVGGKGGGGGGATPVDLGAPPPICGGMDIGMGGIGGIGGCIAT